MLARLGAAKAARTARAVKAWFRMAITKSKATISVVDGVPVMKALVGSGSAATAGSAAMVEQQRIIIKRQR